MADEQQNPESSKIEPADESEASTSPAATPPTGLSDIERQTLIREIMDKETYIDPLDPHEISLAYSSYDQSKEKIAVVLIRSFQEYCLKCLRETIEIRLKNDVIKVTQDEAEQLYKKEMDSLCMKIKEDHELEIKIMLLIFKNHYWNWLLFALKDIFNEQRQETGNPINNQLNSRFQHLKGENGFRTVAELLHYDLTEIINHFKAQVAGLKFGIFTLPSDT